MSSTVKRDKRGFDLATAALEHLELLNRDDQNPLEVAARFRTLLRSRKDQQVEEEEECPQPIEPIRVSYPIVNWKYLRRKRYEQKFQQFISTKFHPRPQKRYSLRSPSPSIRTPCISPIRCPRMNYTVSSYHEPADDFIFPLADCNLLIRCKPEKRF